ncbi:MAG: kojibiose phosphorylase [Halanaerobiales bacterium]|nr:kojibiose phosphorylase [Halanaerobiales bacterium]
MVISYTQGAGKYKNWIIAENQFSIYNQGKFETIFSLGNGYMGLRAATEESYPGEKRGCYIAGLFDRFDGEVTELPNIPDFIQFDILLAGEEFNLMEGKVISYNRRLNLKEGILIRDVEWESPGGRRTKLTFKRFVSMADRHIVCQKVIIKPVNYSGPVNITTGFNGQVTNSGTQHLIEGNKRITPNGDIYLTTRTQESDVILVLAAGYRFLLKENGSENEINLKHRIRTGRRKILLSFDFPLEEGDEFSVEKTVSIYSGIDIEFNKWEREEVIVPTALDNLGRAQRKGFDLLFEEHKDKWARLWKEMGIELTGPDFDQLAVRFALYHFLQMTPTHDSRISIAAKGLSGEGYKGHVFWDTEIFILPFFIYTFPDIARNLLLYRYHTLAGARQKAKENGYRGAMYAWESARTGEETTPKYGHIDPVTGKPIRIWCGDIEQHISADIAYAIWYYFQVTDDCNFMYNYGAEIFLEIARFWASRVEYNQMRDSYEINDVIGPDEYSEHVDNNAYTNYLVKWQLQKAVELADWLKERNKECWERLCQELEIVEEELENWEIIAEKMYTPLDKESGLIEQFEGFMNQKEIDLSPYRGKIGSILDDMSWEEVTSSQVLKQADVVILLYLLGDWFTRDIKKANWDYYEPKTLHDSSLSPAIHAIIAADLGDIETAYTYFQQSCKIDLGEDMKSCDDGLHAASLGGIWQAVVMGFAGVRLTKGKLRINPCLPRGWQKITLKINWRGKKYLLKIEENRVKLKDFNTGEVLMEERKVVLP